MKNTLIAVALSLAITPSAAASEMFEDSDASLRQWSLRSGFDGNLTRGATDLNGDMKQTDVAVFYDEWMASARFKLFSPQNPGRTVLYDTALGTLTFGFDRGFLRLYGTLGVQNGRFIDAGQALVGLAHKALGFTGARRSPPSTPAKLAASVDVVAGKPIAFFRNDAVELGWRRSAGLRSERRMAASARHFTRWPPSEALLRNFRAIRPISRRRRCGGIISTPASPFSTSSTTISTAA